jgi:protein-S-isoprenylcysteine O-methyltransferase Ste14
MKNYIKEGQKLPLFGVGPYIVYGMAMVTILGIVLFSYVLKVGMLNAPWTYIFRVTGGIFVALGAIIWYIGALRSDMDNNIAENKLKTDGIYAWVRNPMYSGWWILITGISLMWANAWILITPVINWMIMTIALKKTEEKWLLDLYGDQYVAYLKQVNRCIPWKRK